MQLDLGNLAALHESSSESQSESFSAHSFEAIVNSVNSANVNLDDNAVAAKAVADFQVVPSIWFINLPTDDALKANDTLQKYMQNVQDYRCWASHTWWQHVYNQRNVPQDGSPTSIANRTSYCAKVATIHMKRTPWLAINSDKNISKEISCDVTNFHAELIKAALDGFAAPTPAIMKKLESILVSLRETIPLTNTARDMRTIVFERFQYIPQADRIISDLRIVSFTITDSIRNVQDAKKSAKQIKCTIEYNEYEARFNEYIWKETSERIRPEQKTATQQFVGNQTVDCTP